MFSMDVMWHQHLVLFAFFDQQINLGQALSIRRHVGRYVQLVVGDLNAKQVELAVRAEVCKVQELGVFQECAFEEKKV